MPHRIAVLVVVTVIGTSAGAVDASANPPTARWVPVAQIAASSGLPPPANVAELARELGVEPDVAWDALDATYGTAGRRASRARHASSAGR
jgi:hypothetical protein